MTYILQHFPKKHGTGPEEDGTAHGTGPEEDGTDRGTGPEEDGTDHGTGRVGREQVSKHSIIWIATVS